MIALVRLLRDILLMGAMLLRCLKSGEHNESIFSVFREFITFFGFIISINGVEQQNIDFEDDILSLVQTFSYSWWTSALL